MKRNPRAFTLIELTIVILIIALLSTGFVISYTNVKGKATFDDNKSKIVSIIQKARDLSLTNSLVNDKEADYYRLDVGINAITLTGYDVDGGSEILQALKFTAGTSSDTAFSADYTPPYGAVTLSTGAQTADFVISDAYANSTTFSISTFGAYPEVSS